MAEADYGMHAVQEPQSYSLGAGALINILGGVVSLALIAGVLVWGYQILARDVSGVPVVQALNEPMRKPPEDPGGQQAEHQGLAVNEVAAHGTASAPRDRLVLAPPALALTEDDAPRSVLAPAPVVDAVPQSALPEMDTTDIATTELPEAEETDVQAILEALAATAEPLEPLTPLSEEVEEPEVIASLTPLSADLGPGVARSLRPKARPVALSTVAAPRQPTQAANEIDAGSIPSGTRLVQLGAYDSAEVARSEWDRLTGRFGDYMAGKQRVIERATKAGRTFYRLRAHGFADVSDARRFCSQLVAQNAACIPILVQ